MQRIELNTIHLADGAAPTAFRLLKPGLNETEKGALLFDAAAATAVMQRFQQQGVDLMIDLNHDSLDENARRTRRDAADAVGWCRLEVRPGPELWAVAVRWNDEGTARLAKKTQRYISPVAFYEPDTRRVREIFNLALVAMPATHGAQPLVAASRAPLGRKTSAVVSTRLPHEVARELALRAAACNTTPAHLLRVLAAAATSTAKDRSRLLDLLGLPADADDAAIRAAVDQLLLDTGEPAPAADTGATASGADNAPPPAVLAAGKDAVERYGAIQLERANRRAAAQAGAATLKAHQERRARK
jgi:hypothetical protein